MERKPSHFGSKRKFSPSGRASASLASIGSMGGAIGNEVASGGVLMAQSYSSNMEPGLAPNLASPCTNYYVTRIPPLKLERPLALEGRMDAVMDTVRPAWHGATVLVVDNESLMRGLVRRTLEAENFLVEEATDGESALALIQQREEPFDLVLTDLSMPGIDGRQLSETLARYRPSVAVLCMSGNPDAVPHIGPADTPVRVMLKPFTSTDLYHAVRDAISRSADLILAAETEIAQAHAGLSRLASVLEASRTTRVNTVDLVIAARELRRVKRSE